jgi:hypothetical protein
MHSVSNQDTSAAIPSLTSVDIAKSSCGYLAMLKKANEIPTELQRELIDHSGRGCILDNSRLCGIELLGKLLVQCVTKKLAAREERYD